jgi:peptidyl-prolyl cis-trans isomerase B (cyclophilin B)
MTALVNRCWSKARPGLLGLCLAWGLTGCGGQEDPPGQGPSPAPVAAAPASQNTRPPGAAPARAPLDPRLHQPFADAVLLEPPTPDVCRPPDLTKAGKVVGKLYEAVAGKDGRGGLWDQVKFATPEGKRLLYTAQVKTDHGSFTLELWPDVAPNHVRNFVALARAGYYDGLEFDRIHRETSAEPEGAKLEYLEAGCPVGTGEYGHGSIGWWLPPELNEEIKHEPGTVGAWPTCPGEVETAACKFYITLTKAPLMDGEFTVFGKVVAGMDVLRTISQRPTRPEAGQEGRPLEPVVIRSVTVQCTEAGL